MSNTDWDIPANLQPQPREYGFDLEHMLEGVVGLRIHVPSDAFTAESLGTERIGHGAVIGDGLVLTIGYLITEAETIWLRSADGRVVPGTPLAIDGPSGFGLIQALGRLDAPVLELGASESLAAGQEVVLAAAGGRHHAIETKVAARQEFAGYWEYVLENAIYVAPAHPFWSGAALLGKDGRLLGIGSLILQQGDGRRRTDMNMVVPIDLLRPVLAPMRATGQSPAPPRPWLGLFVAEHESGLVVGGMAETGPAATAGVQPGDRVLGIGHEEIGDLAQFWRRLWASGPPGTQITLSVERDGRRLAVPIVTAERTRFLRAPRMH